MWTTAHYAYPTQRLPSRLHTPTCLPPCRCPARTAHALHTHHAARAPHTPRRRDSVDCLILMGCSSLNQLPPPRAHTLRPAARALLDGTLLFYIRLGYGFQLPGDNTRWNPVTTFWLALTPRSFNCYHHAHTTPTCCSTARTPRHLLPLPRRGGFVQLPYIRCTRFLPPITWFLFVARLQHYYSGAPHSFHPPPTPFCHLPTTTPAPPATPTARPTITVFIWIAMLVCA